MNIASCILYSVGKEEVMVGAYICVFYAIRAYAYICVHVIYDEL